MKAKFTAAIEEFINEFVKDMRDGNTAIFAGAGLSVGPGYFDWKKLLEPIAKKLSLDINDEYDLTALAQYFVDNNGGIRSSLTQILANEFSKTKIVHSENHKILARLPIEIYWTTNYDDLIEKSLEQAGKLPDVKRSQSDLGVNVPKRDAIVYKMHGDVSDLANTVLTKHEYEDYNITRELFSNAFKADFVARTMLFIGFSFTDPNLDYLISRIRTIHQKHLRRDFYFLKREQNQKALNRQQIRANSLKLYGLNAIWIDNYTEITEILQEIERRYLRSSVFISGSATTYGKFPSAPSFIQELAKELAQNQYKIVTGFGEGVGTYVLNGVLHAMVAENNTRIENYVVLRPFPLIGHKDANAAATKTSFRKNIIGDAGVAIFIFGSNGTSGKTTFSPGMKEEFEIAYKMGLKVIPIPATGYLAAELYEELIKHFSTYYPEFPNLKKNFLALKGLSSPKEIINAVKTIINTINKF
jgi:hypothetical protein